MAHGETYEEFVGKFEPKRTTDDCYTPPEVYEAVLAWACREYGVDPARVVRPFWPGGDFEGTEYPRGCCVVDNPPFSILSRIVSFYVERGVWFFLFAPTLTCLGVRGCSKVVPGATITYENGARVNTSFVTNMEASEARTAPTLREDIERADERARATRSLPRYEYPPEVLTAAMLAKYSKYGIDFRVGPDQCSLTRGLDMQREAGKEIFGSGYILSPTAAEGREEAERAVARLGGRP